MKLSRALVHVVFCAFAFSSLQAGRVIVGYPFGNTQADGRVIIRRAPNFGTNENVIVYIDGTSVGIIGFGATYKGHLSPGPHVIAIQPAPLSGGLGPIASRRVDVAPGATYTFTAGWIYGDTPVLK